ncbi:hypothetical protein K1T71_007415 [Dendrolimus kikuchii]|uniref:Uncharacterized protein n=1 Tax=Dendrolimus kikuchii TaxID=765133 RepID=A0ACC1D0D5_9NEOP|nr:hypothetical protein K1T71_007415 [Dendrolimus kikuchii]
MAVCDKWVALKIVELLFCVACLVTKRISQDDEARLALQLQKFSREWSLLTSVTWDSVGGAFADAIYGGYVIITFGLLLARVFQEIPRGRRILEGCLLGFGMLFFIILGGLELASLDSVPRNLIVNASVLGSFSLVVAALFLLDLMGPRIYYATSQSQTDPISSPKIEKKVSIITPPATNGHLKNDTNNGHLPNDKQNGHTPAERPKDLKLDINPLKETKIDNLLEAPKIGSKNDIEKDDLEKTKFGSLRNGIGGGDYIRLSDPLAEPDRLHYERELAKFHERYFKDYLDSFEGKVSCKENYLPELQTPVFAKIKTGRKTLYDDQSFDQKSQSRSPSRAKTVNTPTLQQLEDYLRASTRSRRADTPALFPMEPIQEKEATDTEGRASGTPTDPGYVQYAADRWPDKRDLRTPRHSPT